MTKRFLFVNLAIDCGYTGVNHGIAYLAPVVKKHGYDVRCMHLTAGPQDHANAECGLRSADSGFRCQGWRN